MAGRPACWVFMHHPHDVQAVAPALQEDPETLADLILRLQCHQPVSLAVHQCVSVRRPWGISGLQLGLHLIGVVEGNHRVSYGRCT